MKALRYILLTLFFSVISILSYAQSYSTIMTDEEIHLFINATKAEFGGHPILSEIKDWNYESLSFIKRKPAPNQPATAKNDTVFTESVIADLDKAYNSIIKTAEDFSIFHYQNKTKDRCQISIPLITSDKKTAIIEVENWYHKGIETGSGGIMVFRKVNNSWKKIDYVCRFRRTF